MGFGSSRHAYTDTNSNSQQLSIRRQLRRHQLPQQPLQPYATATTHQHQQQQLTTRRQLQRHQQLQQQQQRQQLRRHQQLQQQLTIPDSYYDTTATPTATATPTPRPRLRNAHADSETHTYAKSTAATKASANSSASSVAGDDEHWWNALSSVKERGRVNPQVAIACPSPSTRRGSHGALRSTRWET